MKHNKGLAKFGVMSEGHIERGYNGLVVCGLKKPCLMNRCPRHSIRQVTAGIWVVTRKGKLIRRPNHA